LACCTKAKDACCTKKDAWCSKHLRDACCTKLRVHTHLAVGRGRMSLSFYVTPNVFLRDTQFEGDQKTKDIASRSVAWSHCNKVSCESSVMNLAICRLSYHAHAGFFITFLMRSFTIACTTIACTTIPCTRAFAYIATSVTLPAHSLTLPLMHHFPHI